MLTYIVLRLIHYVISIGLYTINFVLFVPKLHEIFWQKIVASEKIAFAEDARKLNKLPIHVGLLFLEKEFSFSDIASVIVWSASLGIHYISVYDINGEIKRNSLLLNQEVQKKQLLNSTSQNSKCDIRLFESNTGEGIRHCASKQMVCVYLLSPLDGHPLLAGTARTVCQLVASSQFRVEDITPFSVDKLIQDSFQCPDPDLVIKFGSIDSLCGFLPWQARLTEILSVPSHIGVSYFSFYSVLQKYTLTQQRCGK